MEGDVVCASCWCVGLSSDDAYMYLGCSTVVERTGTVSGSDVTVTAYLIYHCNWIYG